MTDFTDQQLTEEGLAPAASKGRILLIACGALAREIVDLKKINGWDHMELQCLPAIYHIHPQKIPDAVRDVVTREKKNFDTIFVVYADCGTGGILQNLCAELGVEMIAGPHCYSFFEGNERFAEVSADEITTFYLTDFLVRQFDAFVWRPMGLDRHPELRDMYFGNYEKLVYQSQVRETPFLEKAKECADRLGLEFEHRFTGYGDLGVALRGLANK
ncbi:MAG: DUF1638 domain-containing protein [Pseudomonadota bacterium]|nr:DUF1638 domain-containing protein [Pseudomonadota bacterium]